MKPLVAPAESGEATARHLISTPTRIFDEAAVSAALSAALDGLSDPTEIQAAAVAVLQDAQKNGRAEIARAFAASPFNARPMTSAYCYLTDQLVRTTLQIAGQRLHPLEAPGPDDKLAVIGVGGYGRGEMAPFSDVDLLFLIPQTPSQRTEKLIESMLYMLWDLKLKVGHSTRTIRDCVTLGREDFTIQTALLEHRFIAADTALAQNLDETLKTDLFAGTGRSFIEAKLEERDARHRKQGLRYVVEPNVKEAKGGLRDLQSLFWIAKHIYSVENAADLVDRGVFLEEEFKTFVAAENFLWAVRGHLHLLSGRATEQLTFDMQVAVAEAMVAGVPVIVSEGVGLAPMVRHWRCGTVIPVGDVTALTDALLAYRDPQRRAVTRLRGGDGSGREGGASPRRVARLLSRLVEAQLVPFGGLYVDRPRQAAPSVEDAAEVEAREARQLLA